MSCCPKSNITVKTPPKTVSEANTKHPPKPSHFSRLLEEDLQGQCPGQAAPLWVNYTWTSRTEKERTAHDELLRYVLEGRDLIAFDPASHRSPKMAGTVSGILPHSALLTLPPKILPVTSTGLCSHYSLSSKHSAGDDKDHFYLSLSQWLLI